MIYCNCEILFTYSFCFFQDKSYIVFQHQKHSISCPATPRTADAARHVQLESHEAPNMNQTSPKQLSPPSTSMQFPPVSRAEPAGMVPIRCLSPSRQSPKSEKGNRVLDGNSSVSICRKLLQEVRLGDSKHYKVGLTVLTNIHPLTELLSKSCSFFFLFLCDMNKGTQITTVFESLLIIN